MISVLIVESDPDLRNRVRSIVASSGALDVAAVADSREDALHKALQLSPDVIALNGLQRALNPSCIVRGIMGSAPVPIVLYDASGRSADKPLLDELLQLGAVACVRMGETNPLLPPDPADVFLEETLRLMAGVKLVKRWGSDRVRAATPPPGSPSRVAGIVAIGASTGGPSALQRILCALPPDFNEPILAVQHITSGFLPHLVEWLQTGCPLSLRTASNAELLQPGTVYFAPDGFHLRVTDEGRAVLSATPAANPNCPSISVLFESVRKTFGARSACVLLTGMGRDGADELLRLRHCGALTIAQDRDSCAVYGMPGEAARLGAAVKVCPPEQIPPLLLKWSRSLPRPLPLT